MADQSSITLLSYDCQKQLVLTRVSSEMTVTGSESRLTVQVQSIGDIAHDRELIASLSGKLVILANSLSVQTLLLKEVRFDPLGFERDLSLELLLVSEAEIEALRAKQKQDELAARPKSIQLGATETLIDVAARYYGQPDFWREIAEFNEIESPLDIATGTVIKLP